MTAPSPFLPLAEADAALERLVEETGRLREERGLPAVGKRLFNLQLDTINLCNLQCKECSVHLIRDVVTPTPMSPETLKTVAEQVFPYCNDVNFAALAEPWMSPVIEDAIDYARAAGVPFLQMISNSLLLSEKRAQKLIDVEFDRLNVSTDAATQATYSKVRGNDFQKVIDNIARLRDLKIKHGATKPQIKFNFVMLRTNIHEMPRMVDLAHELGAEVIDFRLPFVLHRQGIEDDMPHHDPALMDEMILATRERMQALGMTIEQLPETNAEREARGYEAPALEMTPGPKADGTSHCDAPWGFLVIWPTGMVHPCCSPYMLGGKPMGNLQKASFSQILTGTSYVALRDELMRGALSEDCAKCKATDFLNAYDLNPNYYVDVGPRLPIAGVPGGRYTPTR